MKKNYKRYVIFGKSSMVKIKQKLAEKGLKLGLSPEELETLNAGREPTQLDIENYVQDLNNKIEEYQKRIENDTLEKEMLAKEMIEYKEARDSYLNIENIFEPNGIIPAIKRENYKETKTELHKENIVLDNELSSCIECSEEKEITNDIRNNTETENYENTKQEEKQKESIIDEQSNNIEIEEMTLEELEETNQEIQRKIQEAQAKIEQKKKEELKKSIMNGQQELEKLKSILASLGVSIDL